MQPNAFTSCLALVKNIYSNFPVGVYDTHVALALLGNMPRTVFNFTAYSNKAEMDKAVDNLIYPGSTKINLGKGLSSYKASIFDTTARPGVRKVLVVFVAGASEDDVDVPAREIRDNGKF